MEQYVIKPPITGSVDSICCHGYPYKSPQSTNGSIMATLILFLLDYKNVDSIRFRGKKMVTTRHEFLHEIAIIVSLIWRIEINLHGNHACAFWSQHWRHWHKTNLITTQHHPGRITPWGSHEYWSSTTLNCLFAVPKSCFTPRSGLEMNSLKNLHESLMSWYISKYYSS